MSADTGIRILFSTAPNVDEAEAIASKLVENKIAACCNIIPGISSVYFWKGEVRKDAEVLIIIKAITNNIDEIIRQITNIHSYELPEIIAIPVSDGEDEYINWVKSGSEEM